MFIRDTANNRIYFSHEGYDRAVGGADVNWAGVAADLLTILGSAGGSVAMGVWGIMWMLAGLAGWGINLFIGEVNE